MKRHFIIITAAFLFGMSYIANAQENIDEFRVSPTGWAQWTTATTAFEGFYEDFESGTFPADWTVYHDEGSATSEWNVAQQSSFGGFIAYDGTKAAFSNGCESHGVNYYLVTKPINFDGSAYLHYYYIAPDYWGDINTLKVAFSDSPTGPWTDLWSTEGNDVSEWAENTIDLSSLNGTYYLAFINANDFGYCVAIDNVSLTENREVEYYSVKLNGTEVATTENQYFQFNENDLIDGQNYTASVAVMSGTGMSDYVDYHFTFTSCDHYEGVSNFTIDVVGDDVIMSWEMPDEAGAMVFQDGDLLTETPLLTKSFTLTGPFENTIELCVRLVNINACSLDYYAMSCPVCQSINTECPAPTDLYGEYYWNGELYGTKLIWPYGGTVGSEFSEGFENGIPASWAIIDADGDGYNWDLGSIVMAGHNIHSHTGSDLMCSQSWIGGSTGPLTPDNYLVTERVNIVNGSQLSFWASAQDESAAAEHFGVAVSTGIQTNPNDFVTIAEWTMTAKGVGTYYHFTVDLSEYAGQKVYLAIRHFNCTDQFILDVDDVELTTSGSKTYSSTFSHFNIYRNDVKIAETTAHSYLDLVEESASFKYQVSAVYTTDDGDCESNFAHSYENPDDDYVMVMVTSLNENETIQDYIYPNPANNTLNINAKGMNRVELFDVVGRKVYENNVNADEISIDLTSFDAGLYIVKIFNTKEEIVRRVSVVR